MKSNQRTRAALLLIDCQTDFTSPNGALYVKGAEKDMQRLAKFITNNVDEIDYICPTLDSHQVLDVSHPNFWQDKSGNNPTPGTVITPDNVRNGEWTPKYVPVTPVLWYLEELAKQGEFQHMIWPEHCLIGSTGSALDNNIMEAIKTWTRKGNWFQPAVKGTNPMTEHFGAFAAQVPLTNNPETQLNQNLINTLSTYERVYFAGEAKSHCVAVSLKQVIKYAPGLAKKFVILEDCMADVILPDGTDLGFLGQPIFDEAKTLGIEFAKSTDVVLSAVAV